MDSASRLRGASSLPPSATFRSRSLSHAQPTTTPVARPRLPRYKSAPQTDVSDGEDDDGGSGSVYERSATADGELAALIGLIGRRGSWYESDDNDDEGKGVNAFPRQRATKAQMSIAKKSWRELYATLPSLFTGFPSSASGFRPPPSRCVLGKAPPAIGLVETPANELFEWVLHGDLPQAALSRRGSHRKSTCPRYVRQTSLEIHLQPPFSSSWYDQQEQPAARSAELLLPPWEPHFSATSPVGSDRTIRPSRQQQEQAERQRQASPARSSRSTASSRAQDFGPSSPLARWERQHRRAESTPLPTSSLGGQHDYDDHLSISPTSSISSNTPRIARRLSRVGPHDLAFRSITARLASPPPPSISSRRMAYQTNHSKAPSLSYTISSTAASSLTSPSHSSSFRFPSSVRSRPAVPPFAPPSSLAQHAGEPVAVKDYRFPRRPSDSQEIDGLPALPLDIAGSSLADLVFASLRASSSTTMDATQKLASGPTDLPARSRPSNFAGANDVFCASALPVQLNRGDTQQDGLRRSRTSAGTSRRSALPTLVGSLR